MSGMSLSDEDSDFIGLRANSEDPMWSSPLARSPPPMLPSPESSPKKASTDFLSNLLATDGVRHSHIPPTPVSDAIHNESDVNSRGDEKTGTDDGQAFTPSRSLTESKDMDSYLTSNGVAAKTDETGPSWQIASDCDFDNTDNLDLGEDAHTYFEKMQRAALAEDNEEDDGDSETDV